MARVVVYVGGFGYGHATRVVAWCRAILHKAPDVEILIVADAAADVLRLSLPDCRVEQRATDGSIALAKNGLAIDREATRLALKEEVDAWRAWRRREEGTITSADVVVSDVVAPVFLEAEKWDVPALGVSNFTWHELHAAWHPDEPAVAALGQAYASATEFLELPFSTGMPSVRRKRSVPLVVRDITRPRAQVRSELGLGDLTGFRGAGVVTGPAPSRGGPGTTVVPHRADAPPGAVRVPAHEVETQDIINACDFVVTKAGYGVLSEALQARIPVFVAPRQGHPEDEALAQGIEALGAGRRITVDDLLGEWSPDEAEVQGYDVPAVERHGADVVADTILEFL